MRKPTKSVLHLAGALAALSLASPAVAVDPPHWASVSTAEDCGSSCHALHSAAGGVLTQAAGNVNLCQSCHSATGTASTLSINNADKAIPGTRGTSHSFDAPAANATFGASSPTNAQMALRVMGGNIVCSTCHDQHSSTSAEGGTPRTSPAVKLTALGSTGVVTSSGTFTGAQSSRYLVEIQTAGALGTARFRWSKDNGTSWMASNVLTAASVVLNSGISANFSAGNYAVGERWEWYGAWPFLRAPLDSGDNTTGAKFCRDCHTAWVDDATSVNTYDGSVKAHPVGLPLGTGGRTYDRAAPLDGNGAIQGSGGVDTNPSNDLKMDSTNRVQCFTCHGPHHSDSNTLSVAP